MHVSLAANGEYRLECVVSGDTVADVLEYVSYSPEELLADLRRAIERAVQAGRVTLEESHHLLKIYEAGLASYTYLEHKWTIDVTGGSTVTFYVEAYHTSNSEGDDFTFSYSTDDSTYYNMVTVTKTSDNDTAQSYALVGG